MVENSVQLEYLENAAVDLFLNLKFVISGEK